MTLRTPAWNDAKPYGFEWWRLALELGLQEGVVGANDHKVTAAVAGGMRVDAAAGVAVVKGDSGAVQTGVSHGLFMVVNDASVLNAVTLTGSDASLPRLDSIYVRANDSSDLGSTSDSSEYIRTTGTPTSGATLDNRAGAAGAPDNALRLADILVPAGSTTVATGNIRDRRPWARGASYRLQITTGDIAITTVGSSRTTIATARIEASGPALSIGIASQVALGGGGGHAFAVTAAEDGSVKQPPIAGGVGQSVETVFTSAMPVLPAVPGSRLYALEVSTAIPSGGSVTFRANATIPLVLHLREQVAQNSANQ